MNVITFFYILSIFSLTKSMDVLYKAEATNTSSAVRSQDQTAMTQSVETVRPTFEWTAYPKDGPPFGVSVNPKTGATTYFNGSESITSSPNDTPNSHYITMPSIKHAVDNGAKIVITQYVPTSVDPNAMPNSGYIPAPGIQYAIDHGATINTEFINTNGPGMVPNSAYYYGSDHRNATPQPSQDVKSADHQPSKEIQQTSDPNIIMTPLGPVAKVLTFPGPQNSSKDLSDYGREELNNAPPSSDAHVHQDPYTLHKNPYPEIDCQNDQDQGFPKETQNRKEKDPADSSCYPDYGITYPASGQGLNSIATIMTDVGKISNGNFDTDPFGSSLDTYGADDGSAVIDALNKELAFIEAHKDNPHALIGSLHTYQGDLSAATGGQFDTQIEETFSNAIDAYDAGGGGGFDDFGDDGNFGDDNGNDYGDDGGDDYGDDGGNYDAGGDY